MLPVHGAQLVHASSPAPQADHDDKEHKALIAFNELWRAKFAHDSLLVFSTGRSHALYKKLQACTPKQQQQPGSQGLLACFCSYTPGIWQAAAQFALAGDTAC